MFVKCLLTKLLHPFPEKITFPTSNCIFSEVIKLRKMSKINSFSIRMAISIQRDLFQKAGDSPNFATNLGIFYFTINFKIQTFIKSII